MPNVSFSNVELHSTYSRQELARLWGYSGFQAIARGVVTPAGQRLILLFVTRDKQASAEPYADRFEGDRLYWEGPTDHYAEDRIVNAQASGDEIHLFYRERHHTDFTYLGRLSVVDVTRRSEEPSQFVFRLLDT